MGPVMRLAGAGVERVIAQGLRIDLPFKQEATHIVDGQSERWRLDSRLGK
jgi:hypothetical protein